MVALKCHVIYNNNIKGVGDLVEAGAEGERAAGHLLRVAAKVAEQLGVRQDGYRLVINEGIHGQQSIRWLHVHLLAGRPMCWPPG